MDTVKLFLWDLEVEKDVLVMVIRLHYIRDANQFRKARKKSKMFKYENGRNKQSILADDIILYAVNLIYI